MVSVRSRRTDPRDRRIVAQSQAPTLTHTTYLYHIVGWQFKSCTPSQIRAARKPSRSYTEPRECAGRMPAPQVGAFRSYAKHFLTMPRITSDLWCRHLACFGGARRLHTVMLTCGFWSFGSVRYSFAQSTRRGKPETVGWREVCGEGLVSFTMRVEREPGRGG